MTLTQKKVFPQLKKSLKNLLTDESGKITKKDALGISAAALLLAGAEDAIAGHSNAWSPALPTTAANGTQITVVGPSTCNHASGIVNGHYSGIPSVDTTAGTTYTHSSHSSHASCGSGHW